MKRVKYTKQQIDWLNSRFGIRSLMRHEDIHMALDDAMSEYELKRLQAELIKLQNHIMDEGQRVIIVFEGRDACGKKNMIRTFIEHLNPRMKRSVALSKPSDTERQQWYFQRYIHHLPNPGEIALFNRSWYNRAVVEPVMGFCTRNEYQRFMKQVPEFERMLYDDDITVIKFWLNITKQEQARRFKSRLNDPLERWKHTDVDEKSQDLWDDYTELVVSMLEQTHSKTSPWVIINSIDLGSAVREAIRHVLHKMDYENKVTGGLVRSADPDIIWDSGSPENAVLELLEGGDSDDSATGADRKKPGRRQRDEWDLNGKVHPAHLETITSRSEFIQLLESKDINYKQAEEHIQYEKELGQLQIELGKLQKWVYENGKRLAIIFEGRDAAGKGGAIKRFMTHLNPRSSRLVALPKPSDKERGQWYFQRYVQSLPDEGEVVFFDRSWYNRAVVEPVNGFCTSAEYKNFLRQVPEYEHMLFEDGIILIKFWFSITKAEQKKRFDSRRTDPLKQWKVSPVDKKAQGLWDAYTRHKEVMFHKTHTSFCPWTIVHADSKKAARLETIRYVLSEIDYEGKDSAEVNLYPDPEIVSRYYRERRRQK